MRTDVKAGTLCMRFAPGGAQAGDVSYSSSRRRRSSSSTRRRTRMLSWRVGGAPGLDSAFYLPGFSKTGDKNHYRVSLRSRLLGEPCPRCLRWLRLCVAGVQRFRGTAARAPLRCTVRRDEWHRSAPGSPGRKPAADTSGSSEHPRRRSPDALEGAPIERGRDRTGHHGPCGAAL
jgi:hypothetical protein